MSDQVAIEQQLASLTKAVLVLLEAVEVLGDLQIERAERAEKLRAQLDAIRHHD
jgi:hypothetical protein